MHSTLRTQAIVASTISALLFAALSIAAPPISFGPTADPPEGTGASADYSAKADTLDQVLVTSTRVSRAGYDAPTPTTVIGPEILEQGVPGTLADALALVPSMRNPQTEGTGSLIFGGGVGRGFVNLRGLGPDRTLVLLDGERIVASTSSNLPDLSLLPSALVKRVEIVTGGSSAAYGSDAIAGVVNFILDSHYAGLKANVEAGTSFAGDATQEKISLASGRDFGEHWHLVTSAEFFRKDGLLPGSRDFASPAATVPNPAYTPTNGQRPLVVAGNAYDANQSYGGLILNGPLSGQQFLAGGTTAPYVPSSCAVSQPYVICPSRANLASSFDTVSLTAPQERATAFARLTFATSDIETHVDALVARSATSITSIPFDSSVFNVDLPINVGDNPFLPASVRSQYQAAGISTLMLGLLNVGEGVFEDQLVEELGRIAVGFDANLSGTWRLKAFTSFSAADGDDRWQSDYSIGRLLNASDSVLANGVRVCRINAAGTTDLACEPANVFGVGNLSAGAKAYFLGTLRDPLHTTQLAASADLHGEPLSTWAGVVSVAAGVGYRRDSADQKTNATAGTFAFTGYPAFSGSTDVTEMYVDAVVPLASGRLLLRSLDTEIIVRGVEYSQSGAKLPWKLGLNWSPMDSLRVRMSFSEDIRAPNVAELDMPRFPSSISAQVNPLPTGVPLFNSLGVAPGAGLNVRQVAGGNPNLVPEVARTTSGGLVWQPFGPLTPSFSVDYYRITIADAITEFPVETVLNSCAAGSQSQCALISFPSTSTLPVVETLSVNAQAFMTSGFDFDANLTVPIAGGVLTMRALANYLKDFKIRVQGSVTQDLTGDMGSGLPTLQGQASLGYTFGRTTGVLNATYVGGGYYDKTQDALIQNDRVPHVWYVHAGAERQLPIDHAECSIYFAVDNLFNQVPPHPGFGIYSSLSNGILTGVPYDRIGRFFKGGVRIRF